MPHQGSAYEGDCPECHARDRVVHQTEERGEIWQTRVCEDGHEYEVLLEGYIEEFEDVLEQESED